MTTAAPATAELGEPFDNPTDRGPGTLGRRVGFAARWWEDVRRHPLQVALLALPVVLLVVMAWQNRWTTEDAFINYRIIDQIFAGNGPVFNAGVRVEASTSTLWLYFLVLLRGLFGWAVPVEWLGVLSGIVFTALGMVGIVVGSTRVQRASGRTGLLVPVGALALAVIPPLWEFTTSGLENGMVFAWIGLTFWALTSRAARAGASEGAARLSPTKPWWLPVLIGSAPLVRPEMAILAVPVWIAFWMASHPGWRKRVESLVIALALPVVYEIFRMGYYASLVPNTALAKEGTATRVGHGWDYLLDFLQPYVLVVPIVVLAALAALTIRLRGDRPMLAAAVAPALGGLLYTAYVVVIGGDYMHGRMMLGPLFGLLAPVAVVALPRTFTGWRSYATAALVAVVLGWTVVAGVKLRAPHEGLALDRLTADEREFWTTQAGEPNPVTVEDYYRLWGQDEIDISRLADAHRDVFFYHGFYPQPLNIPLPAGSGVWAQQWTMGIVPFRMGTDVNYTDIEGLVDPIGSRLRLPAVREQRPGHEKNLIPEFAVAQLGGQADGPVGKAAAHLMTCGPMPALQEGIRDPMTPSLFVKNLFHAPTNTRLRFSADVFAAEKELCG